MSRTRSKKPIRTDHAGKGPAERQAYHNLIQRPSHIDLDATYRQNHHEALLDGTDAKFPSKKKTNRKKSVPKSFFYRASDFLKSPGFIISTITTILLSAAGFLFLLYSSNNREIGEIKVEVASLSSQITSMQGKYNQDQQQSDTDNLEDTMELLKVEFRKDLEFLKLRIEKIENKFSI
jgi:hypothetical protein